MLTVFLIKFVNFSQKWNLLKIYSFTVIKYGKKFKSIILNVADGLMLIHFHNCICVVVGFKKNKANKSQKTKV